MKCVLLKLSGAFLKSSSSLWDLEKLQAIGDQLKRLQSEGVQLAVMVGGGNLFRGGRNEYALERFDADEIGRAATCINALFLRSFFQKIGLATLVYGTDLVGGSIVPFQLEQARKEFAKGTVLLLAGGIGHGLFSTDTAAALRAIELSVEGILKATNVDGVFDQDPAQFSNAQRLDHLTFQQAWEGRYGVMDACAFALCREQQLPIFVFNAQHPEAIYRAVHETLMGTWIRG